MSILRTGQRGEEVRRLQEDLTAAGYPCGPADGIFGPRTTSAVQDLQRAHGLVVDGLVGPRTAAALQDLLDARRAGDAGAGRTGEVGEPTADPVADPEGDPDAEEDLGATGGDPPGTPRAFPAFFDNWDGEPARLYRSGVYEHEPSGQMLDWKGRPAPVPLGRRTHVCCHITAVTFGTSAARRRVWRDRISSGDLSAATLNAYDYDASDPEACATRMALHERFWTVAYHWVGLLNGDVLFNNAPSRYTYHGNRSNRFSLGVAAEAVLPGRESRRGDEHTAVDETFVETNRETLRLAVTTARDQGAPMTHVTAHRCFSMTREGDPGEAYWKEVVLPVAAEIGLTVDYGLVDGGRGIPRDWDPGSPFDWSGNEVR